MRYVRVPVKQRGFKLYSDGKNFFRDKTETIFRQLQEVRFDENLPSETDEHFKKCLIAKKKKKRTSWD